MKKYIIMLLLFAAYSGSAQTTDGLPPYYLWGEWQVDALTELNTFERFFCSSANEISQKRLIYLFYDSEDFTDDIHCAAYWLDIHQDITRNGSLKPCVMGEISISEGIMEYEKKDNDMPSMLAKISQIVVIDDNNAALMRGKQRIGTMHRISKMIILPINEAEADTTMCINMNDLFAGEWNINGGNYWLHTDNARRFVRISPNKIIRGSDNGSEIKGRASWDKAPNSPDDIGLYLMYPNKMTVANILYMSPNIIILDDDWDLDRPKNSIDKTVMRLIEEADLRFLPDPIGKCNKKIKPWVTRQKEDFDGDSLYITDRCLQYFKSKKHGIEFLVRSNFTVTETDTAIYVRHKMVRQIPDFCNLIDGPIPRIKYDVDWRIRVFNKPIAQVFLSQNKGLPNVEEYIVNDTVLVNKKGFFFEKTNDYYFSKPKGAWWFSPNRNDACYNSTLYWMDGTTTFEIQEMKKNEIRHPLNTLIEEEEFPYDYTKEGFIPQYFSSNDFMETMRNIRLLNKKNK
jgi:hypothetical protein